MKAAVLNAYGAPEVISLVDVPAPRFADDEVLVRVAAASFNPADAGIRSGAYKDMIPVTFPHILGADVAGIVEAVGAAATGFQAGDRVFAYVDFINHGSFAEYTVVKASDLAAAPKSLTLGDAAVLPAAGLTAWQALFVKGALQAGQRVLISGASGGVGTLAVQLAKWKRATVIGVASARNEALVLELGVDQFIDYENDVVAQLGQPVDLVINASPAGPDEVTHLLSALRPGGLQITLTLPADAAEAERLGVKTMPLYSERSGGQLAQLSALIDAGTVKPIIAERRPLSDIVAVHQQNGPAYGKLALIVDEALSAT